MLLIFRWNAWPGLNQRKKLGSIWPGNRLTLWMPLPVNTTIVIVIFFTSNCPTGTSPAKVSTQQSVWYCHSLHLFPSNWAGFIAGNFLYLPKSTTTAPQAQKPSTSPTLSHRNLTCNRLTAAIKAAFCSANSASACAIWCWACASCTKSGGASTPPVRCLSMKPRALSNTPGACSSTLSQGTTLRAVNHEIAMYCS